jgi:hypothetical protein
VAILFAKEDASEIIEAQPRITKPGTRDAPDKIY